MRQSLLIIVIQFLFISTLFAQNNDREQRDSLIRLEKAEWVKLVEVGGVAYRKAKSPIFFHNNTTLICDSSYWNANTNVIEALGNVQVVQENTILTSDRIEYLVNNDLAKFRGVLVELKDRDGNVLRTNNLDYNTKDSIATFFGGGALCSKDGNIIESTIGNYYSKENLFVFNNNVEMYTDSVFVKSNKIEYRTDLDIAYFGSGTTAWKDDNLLYANRGDYNRANEEFTFKDESYILTKDQEIWGDEIKYNRYSGVATLKNNIQLLDTTQKALGFADRAIYYPSPLLIEMTNNPSVATYIKENEGRADERLDTLFFRADTILYYKRVYKDIDSGEVALSKQRVELSNLDPFGALDGVKKEQDTTVVEPSLCDTSQIVYIRAFNNVRIFKSDMQGRSDSLVYTDLDSMARFYGRPVLWNGPEYQFFADSMQLVVKDRALSKLNMLSNAFIITQEDSIHFNQIKSTEMSAFFSNNDIYRFDAFGGVSALLFMEEDSTITIMNQKECKMMSSRIKDREIQRTRYVDQLKQDAFPVFNLTPDKLKLRGFEWRIDERPARREDVTDREIRESQRESKLAIPFPIYSRTLYYFKEKYDEILMQMKKNNIYLYNNKSTLLDKDKALNSSDISTAEVVLL